MKLSNSFFRSIQVAALLIIVCVMVGCSAYPFIEQHQPVSASSENSLALADAAVHSSGADTGTSQNAENEPSETEHNDGSERNENSNEQDEENEMNVKKIAITFDDGPDLNYTPRILDILQEKEIKATFFVVGMQVNKYPEVLQRIDAEGHLIGNHSYYHPSFTKLSKEELETEIKNTDDKIKEEIGYIPSLVRPPYGAVNDEVREHLHNLNKEIVLWNIDPRDWDGTSVDDMLENIMSNARDGGIILLHSFGSKHIENTVKLVPQLIDKLKDEGYSFVTVDQL